jgi:hypothetical protein
VFFGVKESLLYLDDFLVQGRQNTAKHCSRHHDAHSNNGRTRQPAEVFRHSLVAPDNFLLFVNVGSQFV